MQLATLDAAPPTGPGWVHEVKLDGYRIESLVVRGQARMLTRGGEDWTSRFPEIAAALARLRVRSATLDGEVVAEDRGGRSSFQALQRALSDGAAGTRLRYHLFDLLSLDGRDLTDQPLSLRRRRLAALLGRTRTGVLRLAERFPASERNPLRAACARGLEGVISKREDAGYVGRRTRDWIKSKCGRRQEFVVVGFTDPSGSRNGLGALLLAVADESGALRYAGKVGSGFSVERLAGLRAALDQLVVKRAPIEGGLEDLAASRVHWVRPRLVAEVTFTEWTAEGRLRHPVFVALREDKPARQVRREEAVKIAGVTLTHPDRVVYDELGLTKSDLATYYAEVAPRMLPHVAGRPLSLVRCPEGEGGECFYQKHWTAVMRGVRTVAVRESKGTQPYAVVGTAADLVRLVQYGVMEFHTWQARADRIEAPDRVILDLDPDSGVPWPVVCQAALDLRAILLGLGLKSWVKTSGGKGLHVALPISRHATWEVASAFARAVAERLLRENPERYVTVASKAARKGKIFIDHLRNSRGATAVAPWSVRARPGAPVSAPIRWEALADLSGGAAMTIAEVRSLLRRRTADPWATLPRTSQRITLAMAKSLR